MSLIKQINETVNTSKEMKRIADHWSSVANETKMSDQELRDFIGDDLEHLEYTPEQIETMVDKIFDMVRS